MSKPDWKPGDYCLVKLVGETKMRFGEIRETRETNQAPYGSINEAWVRLYGKRRDALNRVEIYTRDYPKPVRYWQLSPTELTPETTPDPPPRVADYWQQPSASQNAMRQVAQQSRKQRK